MCQNSRNVTMDIPFYIYVLVTLTLVQGGVMGASTCSSPIKVHNMIAADCNNMNLEEIPRNLWSNIEVLSIERNRIRGLSNSSLRDYTSLRFLYLRDNFITKIEPGAFYYTTDLEVLDLAKNGLRSLPPDWPLPLRTLYLGDNKELQNFSLSNAYNLALLSLDNCDLKQIPSLGILPSLKDLNLTGNPLTSVTPLDLAHMCRLERLYLPKSLYRGSGVSNQCQCHRMRTWTSHHNIALPGYNCTILEKPESVSCDVDFTEEIKVFKACLAVTPPSTARTLLIAVLAGCLVLAIVVIVCWWRKGRRKKNSVQDQKRQEHHKNIKAADTLIT